MDVYTKYKNTHSQNICGTGYGTYSGINNGVTNKLGMTDTTPSTANVSNMLVNFLGIEGCWGYIYEFIEGIHSYSNDDVVIAYVKSICTMDQGIIMNMALHTLILSLPSIYLPLGS